MNPYEVLGVSTDATQEDIKAAHRKLSRKHHPDRGGDNELMQQINQAYDVLSDPARKAKFDSSGTVNREPSVDVQATQLVVQAYMQLLTQSAFEMSCDYDQMVKNGINNSLAKMNSERQQQVKIQARITRLLERTNGEALKHSVNQQLKQVNQNVERLGAGIAVHEHALEALRNFSIEQIQEIGQTSGVMDTCFVTFSMR